MYFGAPVWPLRWQHPYDETIRHIARLGIQALELIAWSAEVTTEYYTPSTIRELRNVITGEGLTLSGFTRSPQDQSSPDPKRRKAAVEDFSRAVDVAAALGAPVIISVTPYPFNLEVPRLMSRPVTQEWIVKVPRGLDWTQNYDDYVDSLRQCADVAAKAGLRHALEPHPFRWLSSAQGMLRLIERTGAGNLGLNLDPSHLFPSGEIPHFTVYMVGNKVFHTHFSDNDAQTNAHWRPGKGKVDWRATLLSLKDVGYDGVISIELEDVPGSAHHGTVASEEMDRELKLSVAYLKEICEQEGINTRR